MAEIPTQAFTSNRHGSATDTLMNVAQDDTTVVEKSLSVSKKIVEDDDEYDTEEVGTQQNRNLERLQRSVAKQKQLQVSGKLVGQFGKPSQIVQDAHLSSRANIQTIPAIRGIRVTRSVWHGKSFSHKLLAQLTRHCLNPEDGDEQDELKFSPMVTDAETTIAFCRTFVDEFLGDCPAGLVPDLSTVYGAISTAVTVKKKALKSTHSETQTQTQEGKTQKKDRELPQVVKKLKACDLDASVDPTMKRVQDLRQLILGSYDTARKPVDLMGALVDRVSFQTTVQNFFCFSFLLKDGHVRMFLDAEDLPVCTPVRIAKAQCGADTPVDEADEVDEVDVEMEDVPDARVDRAGEDKFQTIMMSLTEAGWKELVTTLYPLPGAT